MVVSGEVQVSKISLVTCAGSGVETAAPQGQGYGGYLYTLWLVCGRDLRPASAIVHSQQSLVL